MRKYLIILLFFVSASQAFEKYTTYNTEHFKLAIGKENQQHMQELADFCELSYSQLVDIFGFTPEEKLQLAFIDNNDYANGYAISRAGWVGIYLSPADFALRGSHSWLKNVITHELGHIFSLQALGYSGSFFGAQLIGIFQKPDVPVSGTAGVAIMDQEEAWIAEGLAQLSAEVAGYDTWDAHRDMHERMRLWSDGMIPLPHLRTFSSDGRHSEGLYNQGYSFSRYVYFKLGPTKFKQVIKRGMESSWKEAVSEAMNKTYEEVFEAWTEHQTGTQNKFKNHATETSIHDLPTNIPYIIEQSPKTHGTTLYYLSSKGNDYGLTSLYSKTESDETRIADHISGSFTIYNSNIIAVQSQPFDGHLTRNAIVSIDLSTNELTTLHENIRASALTVCNDKLYFIARDNGVQSIYTRSFSGGESVLLYSSALFDDLVSLTCSPGGENIFFTIVKNHGQDIYQLDPTTKALSPLLKSPFDERDPVIKDNTLYYSANYDGTFQIYAIDLATKNISQLTQSRGGAFKPHVNEGTVYYSAYDTPGYIITKTDLSKATPVSTELLNTIQSSYTTNNPVPKNASHKIREDVDNKLEENSFFGWAVTGYYQDLEIADDSTDILDFGPRVGIGGMIMWSNPTLQSSTTMNLLLGSSNNIGESDFNNNLDPMFNLSKTFQMFNKDAFFTTDLMYMSLDTTVYDTTDGEIIDLTPQIVLFSSQFGLSHMVSNKFVVSGGAYIMSNGISVSSKEFGLIGNLTGGLIFIPFQTQIGIGIYPVYYNIDPGTAYVNSGWQAGIQISPAIALNLYEGGLATLPLLSASPTVSLYTNIARRFFLNIGGSVSSMISPATLEDAQGRDSSATLYSVQAEGRVTASFYIPHLSNSYFKDLSLDFFASIRAMNDNLPELDTSNDNEIYAIKKQRRDLFYKNSATEDLSGGLLSPNTDPSLGAMISLGYISFSNYFTRWQFGVQTSLEDYKKLSSPNFFVQVNF